MNQRDHDDYQIEDIGALESTERAYRRGVHQALTMAADEPALLTDEALNIVYDMRFDIKHDYACFLHTVLKKLREPKHPVLSSQCWEQQIDT